MFQQQQQLAELGRKQLEQAMQQLQEQLQLNLIQQTHLLQTGDKKKAAAPLQQLALQQQQLMQQLQITQRQYLLQQGIGIQPMVIAQAQAHAQAQSAGRPKAVAEVCPALVRMMGVNFIRVSKPRIQALRPFHQVSKRRKMLRQGALGIP